MQKQRSGKSRSKSKNNNRSNNSKKDHHHHHHHHHLLLLLLRPDQSTTTSEERRDAILLSRSFFYFLGQDVFSSFKSQQTGLEIQEHNMSLSSGVLSIFGLCPLAWYIKQVSRFSVHRSKSPIKRNSNVYLPERAHSG